ncbi:MAG: outer membrane lipoprotein-sorting protein [Bradymonadales bacterium]|nr:outer membrane lipoprotein-sorting protein [Bradymonadales bacterium]
MKKTRNHPLASAVILVLPLVAGWIPQGIAQDQAADPAGEAPPSAQEPLQEQVADPTPDDSTTVQQPLEEQAEPPALDPDHPSGDQTGIPREDPLPAMEPASPGTALLPDTGLPLPEVQEVMDYLDDLYRSVSSHSTMTMEVVTENWSRTLELEAWTSGEDNALVVIRSPAREAGTATLRTEDGLWNYAPRADRLVRIPSGLLSDSWMGSHFTNDDLMRESDYTDDFDTTLSWVDDPDGTRYLLATMIPHPDAAVVYTKVEYRLTVDQWIPVRADFFDEEEVVRTFHFSNLQVVGHRTIPFVMEVIPHDHPTESTRVEYTSLQMDLPVDRSLFTPQGLRRAAQRR